MDSFRRMIKMGANLSTFKRSSARRSGACNFSSTGASIIELLKPRCLRSERSSRKALMSPEAEKMKMKKNVNTTTTSTSIKPKLSGENSLTTLGELFKSSPGSKPGGINGGELYVFKSHYSSKRVHPSANRPISNHTSDLGSKALDSFSMKRLVRNDAKKASKISLLDNKNNSSLRRIDSGNKSKKRVSFRLPEEADIIIFYPSDQEMYSSSYNAGDEDSV